MKLSAAEQKKLTPHLQRTVSAIEEILTSGLTTANEATYQTFAVTFQEASRMKLLRLGSTLRSTHEEISRYVKDDPRFSQTRLMFFLNRSWLLCRGIQRAVAEKDAESLDQLLWVAPTKKVKKLSVVCLGVVKKIAAGTFCAFDFRLRSLKDGSPLTWSTVFPMKAGAEIPAEGYLHLPQKQKFTANIFLEGQVLEITDAMVAQSSGASRIQLTDDSKVNLGDTYADWDTHLKWDVTRAVERIRQHQVSPFDVEVELQEDAVFTNFTLGKPTRDEERSRQVYPLQFRQQEFDVTVSTTVEGKSAIEKLKAEVKKKAHSPLFGLLHYASCRMVVQPLTIFGEGKPQYITISEKSVDRRALLSALKFT